MKVVFTGGGTGGHIYPALSLWRYMQDQAISLEPYYIGTTQGLEQSIVSKLDMPFETVEAAGLKRQVSLAAVSTLLKTARGYFQAKRLLKRWRPDVVVGTGGFVTLPVIFAAHSLRIPSVVWEGNARPGLTNQLCAGRTDAVAISFADSARFFAKAKRVELTGNPRASEVLQVDAGAVRGARDEYRILRDQKVILIFLGSRGSESVNRVVTEVLPKFAEHPEWRVLFVTGDRHYEHVKQSVPDLSHNVSIIPFIYDMPSLLPHVDLLISRAGSSTLAEISALGIASILIPSPYVTANHQEENAKRLVDKGAAALLREADLSADSLWAAIERQMQQDALRAMKGAAKSFGTPDAVERFYQLVMDVTRAR
ncbi:undecaprenyldiphospho-muramoylpentapeptide beta-N-acetylglucosaminyltransferase [Alicyclobacillus fastidiosus]|uniref:UDP-N-acetylglucosamine--N-acetylmuramyl-(pentapeptide) pyrophosphoryl-undecaprenol N-acetylglucosamine transferase n=1 Tax=Alicyclobacillus fastidiosus TaxID=392011 RepID=A0ABY6ZC47_9BACL|nr:undecaprenyldiphospho-muramoylpentapeptide beta-N-acetylglucosaminyltransferase [Alicyclobacillus fastidiosus]WAH40437.1 undecaprenyldiphospho-muramoylpentapeptide beta-N-acetylglucosaminyltransferase [Alicyclobacillus fastidiosus]